MECSVVVVTYFDTVYGDKDRLCNSVKGYGDLDLDTHIEKMLHEKPLKIDIQDLFSGNVF